MKKTKKESSFAIFIKFENAYPNELIFQRSCLVCFFYLLISLYCAGKTEEAAKLHQAARKRKSQHN